MPAVKEGKGTAKDAAAVVSARAWDVKVLVRELQNMGMEISAEGLVLPWSIGMSI